MILPDVNILINVLRPDCVDHLAYRRWWEATVNSEREIGMSTQVLSAVARISTNPRAFNKPIPSSEVFVFANHILQQPNCRVVQPGERHWGIFQYLCEEADARGNLVTDAWFAALAIEHSCEWITVDRDYARFPGLRWRTPF